MVDTHAHLAECEPADGELVAAAASAGVRRILNVGMTEKSNREVIAAAETHDGLFASIGRHPNNATGFDEAAAADIERLAAHERVVAIGETGLDFYRDRAPREDQYEAFRAQIEIARRTDNALVIHMRESVDETFELLAAEAEGVRVIIHCFSAPPPRVADAADHGWYCSFAGNVTYPKSAELREAASLVPDQLLLVETDSPFLTPQALRGKPNQPAYVAATAEVVAQERGVSYEQLEELVEANAARVFGW